MHSGTLFDERYPPGEQIPRRLEVVFTPVPGPYGDAVCMVINGFSVGDPLTDRGWSETAIAGMTHFTWRTQCASAGLRSFATWRDCDVAQIRGWTTSKTVVVLS